MSGKYLNGELASGTENVSLQGNNLESVPEWTSRNREFGQVTAGDGLRQ